MDTIEKTHSPVEVEGTPKAVQAGPGSQFSYYRAIVVMLVVVLGILAYFSYLINRPPTTVDKKPTVGYQHLFSIYGNRADRLARPTEVAVDADKNIYVADTNNHRIMVFDADGAFVTQFGDSGEGPGKIKYPSGLAVDAKKNVYVLSHTQNKMVIYNSKHKVAWEVFVESPLAVAVHEDQVYLTTDRGVMVGTPKGQLLSSFGRRGAAPGDVDRPTGIAVDDQKRIFVADSLNYRVQGFNRDGKSLWTLGRRPQYKGSEIRDKSRSFGLPAGLTIGGDGNLYMVDAQTGEIVVVDRKGRQLAKFGEWGQDDGQFYYPAGITYMGDGKFVVADKFNDRVQVVRYSPAPRITDAIADNTPGGRPVGILLVLAAAATAALAGRRLFRSYRPKPRQFTWDDQTALGRGAD